MNDYGAANKYDFDNAEKWHTVPNVPLLDEHEMTNDNGDVIATVDRRYLEEVASNNQRKIYETGDPATLILGHTSDHPNATEKPAQGFIVNPKVLPFRRKDGQVVYALHGDYKLRHSKKHLIEEYPRRSVELWHHKKDIDPVAMLGGSSPERELGVLIRNARINHVSMDVDNPLRSTVRDSGSDTNSNEGVILFSQRGKYTIETYYIEDSIPTYKYSKRRHTNKVSQMGNSRSNGGNGRGPKKYAMPMGPKRGPMNGGSSGMGGSMGNQHEMNLEDDEPERYDELDQDDAEGGEGSDDFDGGGESIPGDDGGMDQDENDPVLAKVFQSKQWNELSSGIGQIKEMLQGMMGGGQDQGGMGGVGEGDGGMGEGEEMPAPGIGNPMGGGQAPPPGAEGMGDEGMEGGEEEQPQAPPMKKPVKMGAAEGVPHSTGMPGPSNGYVPGLSKSKSKTCMSRGSNMPPTRTQNRPQQSTLANEMAILKRQNRDMRIQLSRMKAQADIAQLESEGVLFGPTPEVADKIKYSRMEELTLAYLHDEDSADGGEADTYVNDKIEEMRVCYSRRRPDPTRRNTVNQASVAKYARSEANISGDPIPETDDDNFEDKLGAVGDFQAVTDFADLQAGPRKMSRQDAVKHMRKKYNLR